MAKPLILVVCTANACRSQMAQAFLQAAVGEAAEVASAGVEPAGRVHPRMVEVMAERGFDLGGAECRHVDDFLEREVALVITVCDHADRLCPQYPTQQRRHHWPFKDPVMVVGTEQMIRDAFRRTRDEIERTFRTYGQAWNDATAVGWSTARD